MGSLGINVPALIVVGISIVIGLLMVLVFGYTSDQKAIHTAKDHLKAHLLELRLFQDQIGVVLRAYGKILLATGRYLKLAFKPLLFVIVPLTFLIIQVDRYLGLVPVDAGRPFLVKARVRDGAHLDHLQIQLPAGLAANAPAVHVSVDREINWRVIATRNGHYVVNIWLDGRSWPKTLVVGSGLPRLSPLRLRGKFWERIFFSAESALPSNSPVESIEVQYLPRDIAFAGFEWNWIWLFFVLSLVAGFAFKSILGIEI